VLQVQALNKHKHGLEIRLCDECWTEMRSAIETCQGYTVDVQAAIDLVENGLILEGASPYRLKEILKALGR